MNRHAMRLTYTTDDDGVHIECSCGWRVVLGFEASPGAAYFAALQHAPGTSAREFADAVHAKQKERGR